MHNDYVVCALFGTAFAEMKPVKNFADRKPTPYNGNQFGFVYGGAPQAY